MLKTLKAIFLNTSLTFLFILFLINMAGAADFCVSNAADPQSALTTAASNGEDDVIKIVQGTYIGNFIYSSCEDYDLTIEGGYSEGCTSRVVDPANTVLDGGASGTVLVLSTDKEANFSIDGVTLKNGMTDKCGGGLYAYASGTITLTNNTITGNSAGCGGGLRADAETITLTNNTIRANSAVSGGGLCLPAYYVLGTVTLTNNTITGNSAENGGGAYISLYYDSATAKIYNNIIWNNTAINEGNDLYIDNDRNNNYLASYVNLFNNDFDQSIEGIYIEIPFTIDPTNLNNEDPLFVDPANNDYRLQAGSPCIDAGDPNAPELPAADFERDPRIEGAAPDIGADEYYTGPPVPIPDIKVNGSDGPITLGQSDILTVSVLLDNNDITENADWWLAADTPFGLYFYTFDGWTTDWVPAYQGHLFYLDSFEVLKNMPVSRLPAGTYTLYFGVDTVMDGNVTWDSGYYDTVVVNITE